MCPLGNELPEEVVGLKFSTLSGYSANGRGASNISFKVLFITEVIARDIPKNSPNFLLYVQYTNPITAI